MKNHLKYIFILLIIASCSVVQSQEINQKISNHLHRLVELNELFSYDLNYTITSDHVSTISNVHHIYFNQTFNGLKVLNSGSSIHLNSNNEVVMTNNKFVRDCLKKSSNTNTSIISAKKAIQSVALQMQYVISEPLEVIVENKKELNKITMSSGGISTQNIPLELKYYLNEYDELILIWELSVFEVNKKNKWQIIVDANSGKIIQKSNSVLNCNFQGNNANNEQLDYNKNLVNYSFQKNDIGFSNGCENCYEVFNTPLENPYHGKRSLAVNPAYQVASPFGWHDTDGMIGAEFFVTKGNNINAYVDNEANIFYQPNGGFLLNFSGYDFNQEYSELEPYSDAAITNVFYWGNLMHDILYKYGFTENAGNFQDNNYGNGGAENDKMVIRAQSTKHLCNAFYVNFVDGDSPFIEINICQDKDPSFDNHVLVHEYNHGTTTRLVGGRENVYSLINPEQMGEGWSDWYALMMMIKPDDTKEEPKGIATYLLGQGANGNGIREHPYSTDMLINPLTYDSIKTSTGSHQTGTIWATMLWELTWVLIEEFGFDPNYYNYTGNLGEDAGNVMAMAIITEALKFTSVNPGFIDGRDAILIANSILYGREIECLIWDAFAKRGLGIHANQGSSFNITDGIESFESISRVASLDIKNREVCFESNIQTRFSEGIPFGGVYSGPGVVDQGDGFSYSFNPNEAGLGVHTITYQIFDGLCSVVSKSSDFVEVFNDTEQPMSECPEEISVLASILDSTYSIDDFSSFIQVNDNCSNNYTFTQTPPIGTIVSPGNVRITMSITDMSGNETSCNFNLKVEGIVDHKKTTFTVYPNPAENSVIISSLLEIEKLSLVVMDMNSRLVLEKNYTTFGFEKTLNLEFLSSGMYFMKLQSKETSEVIQLIKY